MGKNKELAKNTAIISIGKFCTQFLSFLLLPLYTSILSTSEYGTVDLLMTYQQLIVYTVFFQIEQAVFRFLIEVRGKKEDSARIISSCFIFVILQTVVLGFVMMTVYYFSGYQYTLHLYVYIIAVIFSGMMLQVARGFGNNVIYAFGSFVSAVSTIILNIVFLVCLHWNVQGMLLSYVLGNLICAIFIFLKLRVYKYISLSLADMKKFKECLMYSLPLVPNALSWWVMSASDRTIVAAFLGTSFNGLLTVAHKFPSAYSTFYTIFNLSWTESAALHIEDADAPEFFTKVIDKVYRLFVAIAIGIIACMPFAFNILVHGNYAEAYYQIPIYMIASVCQVFQGLYSVIYVAKKNTKEIAKSTVVSAVINVAVHLALITTIGLYAASISTLVAYFTLCVWRYFDLKKYMNVPFDKKLLFSSILVAAVVCVGYYNQNTIMCLVCFFLTIVYSVWINKEILLVILQSPKDIKRIFTKK